MPAQTSSVKIIFIVDKVKSNSLVAVIITVINVICELFSFSAWINLSSCS